MAKKSTREDVASDVVKCARDILNGDKGIIEGCRQLVRLRFFVADPDDELFLVFRGVDSETDDAPLGEGRAVWQDEYLTRLDGEVAEYLEDVSPEVFRACEQLVAQYGRGSGGS